MFLGLASHCCCLKVADCFSVWIPSPRVDQAVAGVTGQVTAQRPLSPSNKNQGVSVWNLSRSDLTRIPME